MSAEMHTEIHTPAPATTGAEPARGLRQEEFEKAVAGHRLKVGGGSGDRTLLVLGTLLMVVGLVGALAEYNVTLSQDDPRDIASTQVLVLALLIVTVIGAGLFVAGSVVRVLRLWLLRQLLESRSRDEQLANLLSPVPTSGSAPQRAGSGS